MNKEKLTKLIEKYWFELLISIIIVVSIIFYIYNPEIITFVGLMVTLILIVFNSVKEKRIKSEPYKIVFDKIESILKDIHIFQQNDIMTNRINQKINNLQEKYGTELKKVGCDIEKIDDEITIYLNLGKKKLIAKPDQRIEVRWKDGHRFLDNYEEVDEELKKFRKKMIS